MRTISATLTRGDLAQALRRVSRNGERIAIEFEGKPVAALVPIAELGSSGAPPAPAPSEDEAILRAIIDHSPFEIHLKDAAGRLVLIDRRLEKLFGIPGDDAKGKRSGDFFPKALAEAFEAGDRIVMETGESRVEESEELREDGLHTFLTVKFPIPESVGGTAAICEFSTDITERKRAEMVMQQAREALESRVQARTAELRRANRMLRESEQRYRDLFEESPLPILEEDWRSVKAMLDGLAEQGVRDLHRFFRDNPDRLGAAYDAARRFGITEAAVKLYRAESKEALLAAMTRNTADPEELTGYGDMIAAFHGGAARYEYEANEIACDGSEIVTRIRAVIPRKYRRDWARVLVSIEDITELKRREDMLRTRDLQMRQAYDISRIGYWSSVTSDRRMAVSPQMAAILEVPPEDVDCITFEAYMDKFVHPDDRERLRGNLAALPEREWRFEIEYRILTGKGEVRWLREFGETRKNQAGEAVGEIGTVQDITEHRMAEDRLRQAQKMEAVGQLTGGVAHDFNNLLAVIQGNAELLAEDDRVDPDMIQVIVRAAEGGAELTRRLLAYSRQQPLHPQPIDLAAWVDGMSDMLVRTLGETIDIEIVAAPGLWPALADPGQVENAILNLAINARDAMPAGGGLTIECANVELDDDYVALNPEAVAGSYVSLSVGDSGTGMSPEVLEHAFEPFFTTKEVGEGSGLGLSMVYGFARQSGGHVRILSEERKGTTVKIYLPRARSEGVRADEKEAGAPPRGSGELVLVIEDDAEVRALAVKMLESLGYRVVAAPEARSARAVMAREAVDLVLSDVVLPGGVSGPEFAWEVKALHPDLEVVFMSGYPAEAETRDGLIDPGKVLLNKPFRKRELARALRGALERSGG